MELPTQGRIAGVDYGEVRVGIAICDVGQRVASPLQNYNRRDPQQDARHFRRLVADEQLVGFVVGLPLHASGDESAKSLEARRFGQWLGEATGCPVCYFDERYTTQAAERLLSDAGLSAKRRRQRRDMLAAQIILESFLQSTTTRESPGPLDDDGP